MNYLKDEIVKISDNGILDTASSQAIKNFKHNLEVLIKKTKSKGKIDKFMLIRDDNFFPFDWEWLVSSKNTCLEKTTINLTVQLRIQYALEKANIIKENNISHDKIKTALASIDKNIGFINVPAHFRSTKHFTINTPLGVTGNYNGVSPNRNFTIIDNIDSFLASGYGYSIAYNDAYLDVAHESLPISKDAVVLIEENKYKDIINNPVIASSLKSRNLIIYKGEEFMAINMILTELGVLPSQMGEKYAFYDNNIRDIIDQSIKDLAYENNLLYDKSHGGSNGHFTDYYDEEDQDYENFLNEFAIFLKTKFPEHSKLITVYAITNTDSSLKIIEAIGTEKLLLAIDEYNQIVENKFITNFKEYKINRKTITPEIRAFFQKTIQRIHLYYDNEKNNYSFDIQNKIKKNICHFFRDITIQEQLQAAQNFWNILSQNINLNNGHNELLFYSDSQKIDQPKR